MVTVADIKVVLPNWPDAVIDEWLLYFANDIGWPPQEPFGSDRWGNILGGRPLSWWANVVWKEETTDCSSANLTDITQFRVASVSDPVKAGTATESEQARYRRPMQYLLEHGNFAKPALAMRNNEKLLFLDGHHRLAALSDLRKMPDAFFAKPGRQRPSAKQRVWIGTHPNGELPIT